MPLKPLNIWRKIELMTKQTISETLKTNELFAKKSLGQHFLLDVNLTTKITKLLNIEDTDVIFEIGPGPGGLTQALLNSPAKKIIVIEKDARFVEHLKEYFSDYGDRLEIIEGDALLIKPYELFEKSGAKAAKIIANLPYNVGTQILINWLEGLEWQFPMALMFQTEVAKRVCAEANDNNYGRLSILAAAKCNSYIGMHVPRLAFSPPPKVESAVVVLEPRKKPFEELKSLSKITNLAFGQRRKMIRSSLSPLGQIDELCDACEIKPTIRPENLSPDEFFKLTLKAIDMGLFKN